MRQKLLHLALFHFYGVAPPSLVQRLNHPMINVNQIKSPDKNIHLQRLNVYYTVPSFLFDKKCQN